MVNILYTKRIVCSCDTLKRLKEATTELHTVDATHALLTCPCC
jgi:hypothetical protein